MKRANRLRKGAQFDDTYAKGTVVSGPLLILRFRANSVGTVRWGFAVGKRLAPHAVDRNRTKRRLTEAALGMVELPRSGRGGETGGFDLIVTCRGRSIEASQRELAEALRRCLERAGVVPRTNK